MADRLGARLMGPIDLFQARTSYQIIPLAYSMSLSRVLSHFINWSISFTIVTARGCSIVAAFCITRFYCTV